MNITIREAESDLSYYIKEVSLGKRVVIYEKDVPLVEICPISKNICEPRPIGLLKGSFQVPKSFFDELPEDITLSFNDVEHR